MVVLDSKRTQHDSIADLRDEQKLSLALQDVLDDQTAAIEAYFLCLEN